MAKRYDISPLGESLLGEQKRSRKDNEDDSSGWASLAIQMGIGMGNRLLTKRAEQFSNNSSIIEAKLKNQTDFENKGYVKNTRQSIETSGLGAEGYFADKNYAKILARRMEGFDENTLSQQGKDDMASAARSQAADLGAEQAGLFFKAEQAAIKVISPEDFQARIDLANSRPRNVGSWMTDKMVDLFGGRSQEEIDNDAIERLRAQGEKPGEALDMFKKAYDKSLNWSQSADLVEQVYRTKPIEEVNTTKVSQMQNGKSIATVATQKKNPDGTDKGQPTFRQVELGNYGDPNKDPFKTALADINKNGNFIANLHDYFEPESVETLTNELLEQGINPGYFDNVDQMRTAYKLYGEYHENVGNLKSEFRNEIFLEMVKANISTMIKIPSAKLLGEMDTLTQQNSARDMTIGILNYATKSREDFQSLQRTRTYNANTGEID
jgi:hypothetical protein